MIDGLVQVGGVILLTIGITMIIWTCLRVLAGNGNDNFLDFARLLIGTFFVVVVWWFLV